MCTTAGESKSQPVEVYKYGLPIEFDKKSMVLLVVDLQNDFCHPEGHFAKSGFSLPYVKNIIPGIVRLVARCKESGIPVVYTRHVIRADGSGKPVDGGLWVEMRPFLHSTGLRAGSWGADVLEELPEPDFIIDKSRFSAFYQTDLEPLLRGLQARHLIFSGVVTNVCVESTVRDAFFRDFRNVILSDCVTAYSTDANEASLKIMGFFGAVMESGDLLDNF